MRIAGKREFGGSVGIQFCGGNLRKSVGGLEGEEQIPPSARNDNPFLGGLRASVRDSVQSLVGGDEGCAECPQFGGSVLCCLGAEGFDGVLHDGDVASAIEEAFGGEA